MNKELYEEARAKALACYKNAHIVLTEAEAAGLEVADFGLNDLYRTGLALVTYINTELCCAKEMVLLPGQCCPEHIHAPVKGGYPGKEETFRCRFGSVYLYVEGEAAKNPAVQPPPGDEAYYTVFHEVVLLPGQQHTIFPGTRHWFKSGPAGAVISEFSTRSYDELDIFTDPRIKRVPTLEA